MSDDWYESDDSETDDEPPEEGMTALFRDLNTLYPRSSFVGSVEAQYLRNGKISQKQLDALNRMMVAAEKGPGEEDKVVFDVADEGDPEFMEEEDAWWE